MLTKGLVEELAVLDLILDDGYLLDYCSVISEGEEGQRCKDVRRQGVVACGRMRGERG